jgi:hypothetical protein
MIEKVMKALAEKDYAALAACFSEDCTYFDYCPSLNGRPNSYIYGSVCVEMYFRKQFLLRELEVAEPQLEGENRASYFGAYGGPYIYARLDIEEYDGGGLIKKAVAHPA